MTKNLEKYIATQIITEWSQIAEQILADAKPREMQIEFSKMGAIALIGVRRCGKTSLALLKAKKISASNYLYINFEDPRFIEYNDYAVFDVLIETYIENQKHYPSVIVFDELQNISGWERWVRKFVDSKKTKLIITGSSAKLLSGELATAVAGRVLEYRIWPLSFKEFVTFKEMEKSHEPLALLSEYIEFGGFPEVTLTSQPTLKKKILKQYFTDILFKDVMTRKGIRDRHTLDKIIYHYLSNISCHHSYSSLKKAYQLGGDTPQNYTSFLLDAFLIFEVERYHKNLKIQSRDTKKVYAIDTGLRNLNSKSLTEDFGKLLENIVFLELLRTENKVYYFKETFETDFVVIEGNKATQAIQVTDCDLEETKTYDREVNGLVECLKFTGLTMGTVLTKNRKETLKLKQVTIQMIPIRDFLFAKTIY
jgi:predicted AAA+ superfamily ATPase